MVDTISLLRHAESISNKKGYSSPNAKQLSETGRQQAERLADRLAPLSIDNIACSSAIRDRHTIFPFLRTEAKTAEI